MEYHDIIVDKTNGSVTITINRPPINFMSIETLIEINSVLEEVKGDSGVKIVLFKGAGKHFSAGVEVQDHLGDRLPHMLSNFDKLFRLLIECGKPTLAVVRGVALGGGCELIAGCDMVIASETAMFGQPEIKLGVYPGAAGILVPRLIGRMRAFEFIFKGDNIDAREAERIGLVNKVVPDAELDKVTEEFINAFSAKSGIILSLSKRIFYDSLDSDISKAWEKTTEAARGLMSTEDAVEGLNAYLAKRPPVWKNK